MRVHAHTHRKLSVTAFRSKKHFYVNVKGGGDMNHCMSKDLGVMFVQGMQNKELPDRNDT